MTVDLEYDWDSDKTESWEGSLNKLLDFFDDNKIKSTFFVVTNLIDKYEDKVKEIARKHEIASHSHSHKILKFLGVKELEEEGLNTSDAQGVADAEFKTIIKLKGVCYEFNF